MSANLQVRKKPSQAVTFLDVSIHAITLDQVLAQIESTILRRGSLKIGVVNVAKIVNMQRDPILSEDVKASDLVLADGAGVVWASKLMNLPLPERVAGIDLMYGLFERGGSRIFCLGASEEVSSLVEQKLCKDYPDVILAGRRNGYFQEDEEAEVVAQIQASNADILLVAMSSPKKERFMARWANELNVPVIHGVGGSFDVFSGKVKRAPEIWQKLGLEWLYRLAQEPRRLWKRYLITNTLFIGMMIKQLVRKRWPKSSF